MGYMATEGSMPAASSVKQMIEIGNLECRLTEDANRLTYSEL
jgi:hypothetical protein